MIVVCFLSPHRQHFAQWIRKKKKKQQHTIDRSIHFAWVNWSDLPTWSRCMLLSFFLGHCLASHKIRFFFHFFSASAMESKPNSFDRYSIKGDIIVYKQWISASNDEHFVALRYHVLKGDIQIRKRLADPFTWIHNITFSFFEFWYFLKRTEFQSIFFPYGFWPFENIAPRWNQIHSLSILWALSFFPSLKCHFFSFARIKPLFWRCFPRFPLLIGWLVFFYSLRIWRLHNGIHCAKIGNVALVHCLEIFYFGFALIHLIAWVLEMLLLPLLLFAKCYYSEPYANTFVPNSISPLFYFLVRLISRQHFKYLCK